MEVPRMKGAQPKGAVAPILSPVPWLAHCLWCCCSHVALVPGAVAHTIAGVLAHCSHALAVTAHTLLLLLTRCCHCSHAVVTAHTLLT